MDKMRKIELLAPAGNFECLTAAVQSGADAVYFAGKNFGARSYADNFDKDSLKRAIDYCHLRNVKTHITVNTALNDDEVDSALEFVHFLYEEGADAIIVSDIGLAAKIKKYFPDFSLHASTQLTVHNTDGVKFAQNMGFDRVVLSRELSYDEIKNISLNTDTELEIFAHGALCMCYSGQCLLSSVIGGRSGNRGSCAQPCRLPFSSDKNDSSFVLSLKDMCLARHLNMIKRLRISSLKIEGRMKGPAYVAAVTSIYRKYLDTNSEISDQDFNILEKIFFRGGLTDGYFTGKKSKLMFDFEKPDNPYLKQTKDIIKSYDKNYNEINDKKTDILLKFFAHKGKYPEVFLNYKDFSCEYIYTNPVQSAVNKPIDGEFVKCQLNKTGGTPYNFSDIYTDIDNDIFISKAELNEIRRNALKKFEETYTNSLKRIKEFPLINKEISTQIYNSGYTVYVSDLKQLDVVLNYEFERIYVPVNLIENITPKISVNLKRIVVSLPEIVKDFEKKKLDKKLDIFFNAGINKLLIHNVGQLCYVDKFDVVLSHRFNIWNSSSTKYFNKFKPISVTISPEVGLKNILAMKSAVQCEYIVYGHLPVMITENCIVKNIGHCPCQENQFYYIKDRKGISFPVKTEKDSCRSILYNSVPIYLADKINSLNSLEHIEKQIMFTVESVEECEKICMDYLKNTDYDLPKFYTRGSSLK